MSNTDPSPQFFSTHGANIEALVADFEQAWRGGCPPALADFLPREVAKRREALLALVPVDLEYRWKLANSLDSVAGSLDSTLAPKPGGGLSRRPRIEEYLREFPELAPIGELPLELVAVEYRARHRWGDRPPRTDPTARFPSLGAALAAALGRVDEELAAEELTVPLEPAAVGTDEFRKPSEWPVVPEHDVLKFLGRGGMGIVLQARHKVLDRLVAVKMPLAGDWMDDADRQRFLREARATARLRHPNICTIFEVGETGNRPYITMAFIEGESLGQWARHQKPKAREAAEMVAVLARAVEFAHQQGVVHRDIKPQNVMVDRASGQPILMDFGLAKEMALTQSELTQSGQVLGTPAYMAPEQAAGQLRDVGPWSDIYALGAVLYHLLCGRPPYVGNSGEVLRQVQVDEPPAPHKLAPHTHRDLETICLTAMAREPLRRYASAAALASDLQRFIDGEAILARREGWPRKISRMIRRRPVVAALTTILLLTIAWFTYSASATRRTAELQRVIRDRIDANDLTPSHFNDTEAEIDRLATMVPKQAELDREQFHQRFAASIQKAIQKERVPEDESARIEAGIAALAVRDGTRAAELSEKLADRLRDWQLVFELGPPFANVAEVFDPEVVHIDGDLLRAKAGTIATRVACVGDARVEAEFHCDDIPKSPFGVLVGTDSQTPRGVQGYGFLVGPATHAGDHKQPLELVILRNGAPLRREPLDPPVGAWRFSVSRVANHLSFKLNDLPVVDFHDLVPLSQAKSAVFAVEWPEALGLTSLRADSRPLPKSASPLESGDDQFSRGRFADALAEYQDAAVTSTTWEFSQEARYKQALCLVKLSRREEATLLLENLCTEQGERWPPLAFCQLWSNRLQDGKLDEAFAVFENLSTRYPSEFLRPLVSVDLITSIVRKYHESASGASQFFFNADRERDLERAGKVQEFFGMTGLDHDMTTYWLYRSRMMMGDNQRAIQLGERLIRDAARLDESGQSRWVQFVETYAWLLRLRDGPQRALNEIQSQMNNAHRQERIGLLVEQARCHAALNQWEQAQQDLDELNRALPAGKLDYRFHAEACLLRGFFADRKGDAGAAQEEWLKGVPGAMPEYAWNKLVRIDDLAHSLLLASLADKFTTEDLEIILSRVTGRLEKHFPRSIVKGLLGMLLDLPPATLATVVRQTCRRASARELARQIAFRDLAINELFRKVLGECFVQLTAAIVLDDQISTDQAAVCHEAGEGLFTAYYAGKLTMPLVLKLALTWKGLSDSQGWEGVAPALAPELRGPLAYIFGIRHRRLKNHEQSAAKFFDEARKCAKPDSALGRLLQSELEGGKDNR